VNRPARPRKGRWSAFRMSRYRRGRLATTICGGYVALVILALGVVLYDMYFVEHLDASFAGIYLIALTLPLSMLAMTAADTLLPIDALPGPAFLVVLVGCGLLQALGLWFVLRGPANCPPSAA
jgi:hypothetical protein